MISLWSILSVTHFVGLALGVGAATVKLMLLLRCNLDYRFVPVYIQIGKSITRLIVLGLILLTLSGIGWMLLGFSFTTLLVVKIVMVSALWIIGPTIDKAIEPKFEKLAPKEGGQVSPDFLQIQKRYLALEVIATVLFYAVVIIGVLI